MIYGKSVLTSPPALNGVIPELRAGMPVPLSISVPPPETLAQLRCPYRSILSMRGDGSRYGNQCRLVQRRCRPGGDFRCATIRWDQTVPRWARLPRWPDASARCLRRHKLAPAWPVRKSLLAKRSPRGPYLIGLTARPSRPIPPRPARELRASAYHNATKVRPRAGRNARRSRVLLASHHPG